MQTRKEELTPIEIGKIKLMPLYKGRGWAIPGGGQTPLRWEAIEIAKTLNAGIK